MPLKIEEVKSLYKDSPISVQMSMEEFDKCLAESKINYKNNSIAGLGFNPFFVDMDDSGIYIIFSGIRIAKIDSSKINEINLYRTAINLIAENADSSRINKTLYCFN